MEGSGVDGFWGGPCDGFITRGAWTRIGMGGIEVCVAMRERGKRGSGTIAAESSKANEDFILLSTLVFMLSCSVSLHFVRGGLALADSMVLDH